MNVIRISARQLQTYFKPNVLANGISGLSAVNRVNGVIGVAEVFEVRNIHTSLNHHQSGSGGPYEGDGKTTVSILNKELTETLLIDSYAVQGFRLNTGAFIIGPIAIFARMVLHWDIATLDDINEDSLSLFYLLEPQLEVLVIGTGDGYYKLNDKVIMFLKSKKIHLEILPTHHAVSTFNYLTSDNRIVAGAFIPPANVTINDSDEWLMGQKRKERWYDSTYKKGYYEKFWDQEEKDRRGKY